jgi:hypothetical protein
LTNCPLVSTPRSHVTAAARRKQPLPIAKTPSCPVLGGIVEDDI